MASQQAAAARRAVAFLGPAASYTHQATRLHFSGPGWELVPVGTITDVFEAVAAGRAAYGVVPFENSTHGPVTPALAGLADRDGAYAALGVCGEVHLAVHHCLLGRVAGEGAAAQDRDGVPDGPDGQPLVSLDHIARVYSHPQAFGQTAAFARRFLPAGAETLETSSTSRAAALAAADATGRSAAIAGALAAETSGLAVLARSIEDRADNTTRFFVLRGEGSPPLPEEEKDPASAQSRGRPNPRKHLVSFTVPHRHPGALAAVLDCFRRGGLNLTSINSVPSLAHPFQYVFLVEFEEAEAEAEQEEAAAEDGDAHRERADAEATRGAAAASSSSPDARVQQVLAEVARVAQTLRLLGSWTKPAET